MGLEDIYNWSEQRFNSYSHSLRIYIYGVEVSAWLKGSLSVTYSPRDSYNTASFDLSNPKGIFQVVLSNLGKAPASQRFRLTDDMFNEKAKYRVMGLKMKASNVSWDLSIKTSVNNTVEKGSSSGLVSSVYTPNPYNSPNIEEERKYRLLLNDCIFSKNDPVRIFCKNPFSQSTNQWMEIFCGFVQEHPISTNYLTGESTVRISCSCIKQQLQKMRVNLNNHLATLDNSPIVSNSFYQDFLNEGINTHPFATSNLESTIKQLILGTVNPPRDPKDITDDMKKHKVGDFKLGNIVCYNPSNPGNTLERWHLMTVFGVNKVPFPNKGDQLWLTKAEMKRIGENTYPSVESNAVVGGPTARYLHMLLPSSGTGPGSLISYDIMKGNNAADKREWTTRWEVIRDFASKVDFQVLTSPSGDILVEFPQYGFNPCAYLTNFGNGLAPAPTPTQTVTSTSDAAKSSLSSPLAGNSSSLPKGFRKDWSACQSQSTGFHNSVAKFFIFNLHQKEDTLNDEAEDFPTILQVGGGVAFAPTEVQKTEVLKNRAYVWSPALVDRYGVISESVDFPFAGQRGQDLENNEAVFTKRLKQLGLIEYTKRMADAATWQGSLVYRPFIFPNRPLQLHRANRCGLTTTVTYQWNIGQSATLQAGCHMLMARRLDNSWRLMTGSVNCPIDYGAIWAEADTAPEGPGTKVGSGSSPGTDKNSQAQQSQPVTKDAKAQSSPATPNLSGLYPPFRELIEELLAIANKLMIPLSLTSAVRTVEQDNKTKAGQTAGTTNAKGQTVDQKQSKGTSLHNIGLAVDFAPANIPNSRYSNHPAYVSPMDQIYRAFLDEHKDPNDQIYWGGLSRTFTKGPTGKALYANAQEPGVDPDDFRDLVHFEAPHAWFGHGGALKVFSFYTAHGKSEEEAREKTWQAISSTVPALTKINPNLPTLSATELAQVAPLLGDSSGEIGAAQKLAEANQGVVDTSGAPASCSITDNLLTVPGLA